MTITAYRSELPVGNDDFRSSLRAEWTKFRTVRGWIVGAVVAALLMVLFAFLTASGSHSGTCVNGKCTTGHPPVTLGPDGTPVNDSFFFVHQPLAGDGSITVRVTSLTGLILGGRSAPAGGDKALPPGTRSGLQPWAKAGIIVKQNTTPGSPYAAIMVTGGHGVRMQDNFTHDTAGGPGTVSATSPQWLRLTRSGDVLTGYESTDGVRWTRVGTVRLPGLTATVPAGPFVSSPQYEQITHHLGGTSGTGAPTVGTATFDRVSLPSGMSAGAWTGTDVGNEADRRSATSGHLVQSAGTITATGSGDIAPNVDNGPNTEHTLTGTFATVIVLAVLATMFITAEYRRGLIRTTLTASPRRGRTLAAKSIVIGGVAFVVGVASGAVAIRLGEHLLRSNGNFVAPVATMTQVRILAGTGLLLAAASVLALALGTILRRAAGAVSTAIVVIVAPYILSVASVLPGSAAQWLLRLTPAAGFAIQQSQPRYPQVNFDYTATNGYFPLGPWTGLAVLCGYAAVAMALAVVLLRRRDA